MSLLPAFLRFVALGFVTVSALHLALGLNADILLGAKLPPEAIRDPVLDSQNRFYGVAFAIYGVLLAVGASDLKRHALMLHCCFWCFFAGGLARLVSMALHGMPSAVVMTLTATELFLPPLLTFWLGRATRAG